ncbi:MAG: TonB-dependent receptor [Paludibacteraceae bacterium]|nr:TonB-dependent receptor [Paludibacteraceae bacterium]MBO7233506.1 TonB-dependent receptor [Paludibacteraceae bacterium]MBO7258920.1 TonB-dependent receptor [Paludibacteraceae bacterium]
MEKLTFLKKVMMSLILSVSCFAVYAQTSVSGTVVDDSGEPLIGVSIMVKGTTNGSITDFDGNFTLSNVTAKDVLVFSYIGYGTKEITVANQKVLKVVLSEDTKALDEVVVVGYGQMKKNDLTGSVSSVDNEKLTAKGTTGVVEALQGSVAGVNITQATGRTGGGFDIEIRGKSSTNSDTKPIYVVDGIICDDIDWLNPQDISRIDVLKDASSTAIYGSRATAGVVQVTTKSGSSEGKKESKPSISYDMYVGSVNPTRVDMFMDAQQFYNYRFLKFMGYSGGASIPSSGQPVYTMAGYEQMALYNDGSAAGTAEFAGQYRLKQIIKDNTSTDWMDLVTRTGLQQNHYVSVNGSNEHVAYHMGIGYNQDRGIYVGDEQQRVNFKGSIDATINKYVQAGINFNLSWMGNEYANDDAIKVAYRMNPFMQAYNKDGVINEKPGNFEAMGSISKYQFSDQVSPLLYMQNRTKQRDAWRAMGNIYLQITPVKGLQIKSMFAPNYGNHTTGQFDNTLVTDYDTNVAQLTKRQRFSYTWDNTISYNETFAKKHNVNLMGLFSLNQFNSNEIYLKYTGVMDGTLWYNLASGTYDAGNSKNSYTENSMASFALRANYSYAGKYMVTATMRADGSSKFAKGHQWGYFPSAALAWRMSEETWMKEAEWITNLKWRLSYGMTGNNSGIGNYATVQGVAGPIYYPFGNSYMTGYYPSAIVDPELTWETSSEWNAGLDFGFLRDRITGTVDFYNKVSDNLLYAVELPLEAGGQTVITNVGSVLNRGVEVGLKTVNVDRNGWRWETSFTLAHNHNEVLEINGSGTDLPNDGLFRGQPINNVYGYQWDGIVSDKMMVVPNTEIAVKKGLTPGAEMKEADYYYACYGWTEGQPIIRDVDGNGQFSDADKKVYSSDPKITGSLTSTLTWKGIEFSFSLYGKYGQTVESEFYSEYLNYSDRGRMRMNMDYYIPAGTLIDCDGINENGTYINPVFQETTHYGKYPFPNNAGVESGIGNAYWLDGCNKIVDASFLKVKYITLAYSFQKRELEKLKIKKLRIYCTVTNPFCFTKYEGFDPEWAHTSLQNDAPATVNAQLGLSLKF